jgi:hypothetical protein
MYKYQLPYSSRVAPFHLVLLRMTNSVIKGLFQPSIKYEYLSLTFTISLALALTRFLKWLSHSEHTKLDTERSIKTNTKILLVLSGKKTNHCKHTLFKTIKYIGLIKGKGTVVPLQA